MTIAEDFVFEQDTSFIESYRYTKQRITDAEALLDSKYCINFDEWDSIITNWWCFSLLRISFERSYF